jgi:APA family basic amino acid/polyamine antiporter
VLGLLGCVVLAVSLPLVSTLTGAGVLLLGALVFAGRHKFRA